MRATTRAQPGLTIRALVEWALTRLAFFAVLILAFAWLLLWLASAARAPA